MELSVSEVDFPRPKSIGTLSNHDVLFGLPIPAIDRMKIFSPDQFEDFVREWVTGYLIKKGTYTLCKKCSGSGDMGRDVIAFVDKTTWDNFQCKHYDSPLMPSAVNSELGKLVYYTHKKIYTLPQQYYFVSPKGVGPKLNNFFENPTALKEQLIQKWDEQCRHKISKDEVELTPELRAHLDIIDFSIFSGYDPQQLIDEHHQTPYYSARFGGGLQKQRQVISAAPDGIDKKELVYTNQLFAAYGEFIKKSVTDMGDLKTNEELFNHFLRQRTGFYSADSLNQFSRDTLPPDTDYFEDLKNEFYTGIIDVLNENYTDGYQKVKETTKFAKQISMAGHPLGSQLRVPDREGICHHLANENRIKWVTGK